MFQTAKTETGREGGIREDWVLLDRWHEPDSWDEESPAPGKFRCFSSQDSLAISVEVPRSWESGLPLRRVARQQRILSSSEFPLMLKASQSIHLLPLHLDPHLLPPTHRMPKRECCGFQLCPVGLPGEPYTAPSLPKAGMGSVYFQKVWMSVCIEQCDKMEEGRRWATRKRQQFAHVGIDSPQCLDFILSVMETIGQFWVREWNYLIYIIKCQSHWYLGN